MKSAKEQSHAFQAKAGNIVQLQSTPHPASSPGSAQALSSCSVALAGRSGQPTVSPSHFPLIINSSDVKVQVDEWNKERQGHVDNKQFITNMNTDTVMHWRTIF